MPSFMTAVACVVTVLAAWLSQGTIAPGDAGAARLGAAAGDAASRSSLMLFAGVAVVGLGRVGASRLPLLAAGAGVPAVAAAAGARQPSCCGQDRS